jgi:hypothetical protein
VGGATGAAVVELMEELWLQQQRGSDRLGVLLAGEGLARRSTTGGREMEGQPRSSCRQRASELRRVNWAAASQGDSRGAQQDLISLEIIHEEADGSGVGRPYWASCLTI